MPEILATKGTEIRDKNGNLLVTVVNDVFRYSIVNPKDFSLPDGTHPEPDTLVPEDVMKFFEARGKDA